MNRMRSTVAAVIAGGLVLAGCGREPSVASKSAAAFREAQKRGETFSGEGHAHGGMAHPGETPEAGGDGMAAMEHEHQPAAPAEHGGHATMEHGGHAAKDHEQHVPPKGHGGHAAMEHGQGPAAPGGHSGHAAMQPESGPHAGHTPAAPPIPAPASPGQPAATLRPDAADAPAATSVIDAQRAAALAGEMAGGGHGGHGAGTYRQLDAGREPAAQHDHEPPAERRQA